MKRLTLEGPDVSWALEVEDSFKRFVLVVEVVDAVDWRRLLVRPRGLKVETDILFVPRDFCLITTCYRNDVSNRGGIYKGGLHIVGGDPFASNVNIDLHETPAREVSETDKTNAWHRYRGVSLTWHLAIGKLIFNVNFILGLLHHFHTLRVYSEGLSVFQLGINGRSRLEHVTTVNRVFKPVTSQHRDT